MFPLPLPAYAWLEDPGAASPARPEVDPVSEPPQREDKDDPEKVAFNVAGYVETFYQWNFNVPGNGISNYRGYDTKHNTIALHNAVIDVGFRAKRLMARTALQIGEAPTAIYEREADWRFLQRASLGFYATDKIILEAGIFPSTTGVESLAVKENWNWSRSTGSTRLPNYHAGARATFDAGEHVDVFVAVLNGWNTIVDNNAEKSFIVGAHYRLKDKLTLSGSYFGGVERDGGAPEGRPWRHGFESWVQWDAAERLSFAADGSAGFEKTHFGMAWWTTAAIYGRAKITEWLFGAARVDRTWEDTAGNGLGGSAPILIPAKYATALTGTFDLRPVKGLSTRLELRHDTASRSLYYRGDATEPNSRRQTTLLLGVTAWFQ